MILDDKFEILVNPGWEYWEEHLANVYKHEGWTYSPHDFSSWKTGFGDRLNHFVLVEKAEKMSPKYASRDGYDKFYEADIKKTSMPISEVAIKNLEVDGYLKILQFSDVDFEKFMEFDRKFTDGLERGDYLKAFLTQPGAYSKLAASTVLKATLEAVPNFEKSSILKMVVPSNNSDARKLFDKLSSGKAKIDAKNFIQFTKVLPKIPGEKIYAVTECTISYC